MKSFTIVAASLMVASQNSAQATRSGTGIEEPSAAPTLNAPVVQGCFHSAGSLKRISSPQFNSKSSCAQDTCYKQGFKVAGTTGGQHCYCGNTYPPLNTLADDSKCNIGCTGYDLQACGGNHYWTIYNSGLELAVDYDANTTSPTTTSAVAVASKSVTVSTDAGGSTIYVTATSAPAPLTKDGGSNTAGIAVGAVVAVLALIGIAGGAIYFLRRRRNQDIEEEHRRNAAVNAIVSAPPGSSGTSLSDSRLDPVMVQRRLSSGSIADNQDYSRKILRVTNA